MQRQNARIVFRASIGLAALSFFAGAATAGNSINNWTQDFINGEPFPQNWQFDGVNSDGLPAAEGTIRLGIQTDANGTAGLLGNDASTNPLTSTAIATSQVSVQNYTVTALVNPLGLVAAGRQGVVARYVNNTGYVAAIDYGSGDLVLARFDRSGPSFSVINSRPIPGFVNTNSYFVRILVRDDAAFAFAFNSTAGAIGTEIDAIGTSPINAANTFGDGGLFVRADSQATPAEMRLARVFLASLNRRTAAVGISEDIFFTNAQGEFWVWGMANTTLTSVQQRESLPAGFELVTTADFNDDSLADPILHNTTTGQTRVRLSNLSDSTYVTVSLPTVAAGAWEISGAGDFNMDGIPDLIYRNIASNELWLRTVGRSGSSSSLALTSLGTRAFFATPAGWELQAVGDFTGDGFSDLFFRNDDGSNGIINVRGAAFVGWDPVPFAPVGWEVVGLGDYNDDGRNDLLWQNTDGSLFQWTLNGTNVTATSSVQSPGAAFIAAN